MGGAQARLAWDLEYSNPSPVMGAAITKGVKLNGAALVVSLVGLMMAPGKAKVE